MDFLKKVMLCVAVVGGGLLGLAADSAHAALADDSYTVQTIDSASTNVTDIAQTAAIKSATMLTNVATVAIVLLVIGAGIMFVWKFFTAGRARC